MLTFYMMRTWERGVLQFKKTLYVNASRTLITYNYLVISDSDISQTIILWRQILSKNGKQEICRSRTSNLALFSFYYDYDSLFVWDAASIQTDSHVVEKKWGRPQWGSTAVWVNKGAAAWPQKEKNNLTYAVTQKIQENAREDYHRMMAVCYNGCFCNTTTLLNISSPC